MKIGDEIIYTEVIFSNKPVVKYVHKGVILNVYENSPLRYWIQYEHKYTKEIKSRYAQEDEVQLNISKIREDKLKILGIY
jgi:hypothetical protein